jgi:hypothetical protein
MYDDWILQVMTECKETAAKRRRQSNKLENLGIPEEELLRQQQELFAKAREAAALQEMQQEHCGVGGHEGHAEGEAEGDGGGHAQDSVSEEESEY